MMYRLNVTVSLAMQLCSVVLKRAHFSSDTTFREQVLLQQC